MENKKIFACLIFACSSSAFAGEGNGFYVGGGLASTAVEQDVCSDCTTSGVAVEGGYTFNRVVDIDAKISTTDSDNYDYTLDMQYLGVNIGTDFGTKIFRLYGKIGYAHTVIEEPGYTDGSDSNVAYGIGARFTFGERKGVYIKLESIATEFLGDSVGAGTLSVGYQF